MDYRVTTKNSLTVLKKTYFIVNRNFTDFLVLHGKLVAKHLPRGIIVPPLPEKSSSVRLKNVTERRRAGLERYLNRLARKEVLHGDSDFELFIEHTSELPKITNDSWRRLLCTSTARLQDGDWFDKKQVSLLILN